MTLGCSIITGGSGFVGIELVRQILGEGGEVRVFDLNPPSAPDVDGRVEFVCGDVRDRAALVDAARGCDRFFHIAAMVPLTRAGRGFDEVNVGGVENAVAACLESQVEHLVHLSSSAIYGVPVEVPVHEDTRPTPFGLYGPAKLAGERVAAAARAEGLPVAIIRPRTVIGPGRLGIFDLLFEWIQAGAPIFMLGSANKPFQLLSNRDLSMAMLAAANRRASGEYNVGADQYTTLRADLDRLAANVGSPSRVLSVPAWLARPGLRLLDALRLSPLVDWHYKTIDKEFWFDNVRPKAELGWTPQDSNIGMLEQAYSWYVENAARLESDQRSAHRSPLSRGLLAVLAKLTSVRGSGERGSAG
jgi:nucleoside-diphosphate-sugar epimerase